MHFSEGFAFEQRVDESVRNVPEREERMEGG